MKFSMKFDTVKSGWSIIYFEGSQVIIFKNIIFIFFEDDFVLANSVQYTLVKCGLIIKISLYNFTTNRYLGISGWLVYDSMDALCCVLYSTGSTQEGRKKS